MSPDCKQFTNFLQYLTTIPERFIGDTRVKRQNPQISMAMYEVYNELIKDLLTMPGGTSNFLELGETAEKGTYVKVSTLIGYNCNKHVLTVKIINI